MIKVMKFGGTSINTEEGLLNVVSKVKSEKGTKVILVVSAPGRMPAPYATNTLEESVKKYTKNNDENILRELDVVYSVGEIYSIGMLSMVLNKNNISAQSMNAWQAGIITDTTPNNANILYIRKSNIKNLLKKNIVPVIAGFQGTSVDLRTTTLGKEGSDITAAELGKRFNAKEVHIYSNVDGIYDKDPNKHDDANFIDNLTYDELLYFRGQILHSKVAEILINTNVELYIKNTYNDSRGTLIKRRF